MKYVCGSDQKSNVTKSRDLYFLEKSCKRSRRCFSKNGTKFDLFFDFLTLNKVLKYQKSSNHEIEKLWFTSFDT
eukprot:UN18599